MTCKSIHRAFTSKKPVLGLQLTTSSIGWALTRGIVFCPVLHETFGKIAYPYFLKKISFEGELFFIKEKLLAVIKKLQPLHIVIGGYNEPGTGPMLDVALTACRGLGVEPQLLNFSHAIQEVSDRIIATLNHPDTSWIYRKRFPHEQVANIVGLPEIEDLVFAPMTKATCFDYICVRYNIECLPRSLGLAIDAAILAIAGFSNTVDGQGGDWG